MTLNPTTPTASLLAALSAICIATLPTNAAFGQFTASTGGAATPLDSPTAAENLPGGGESANWLEDDWEATQTAAADSAEELEAERWNKTGLTFSIFGGLAQFDELSSGDSGASLDDGFLGGASLGWDFGLIRFDLQGLLAGAEPEEDSLAGFDVVGVGAGTVNLYVDIPLTKRIEFYGGGGVGIGVVAVNFESEEFDSPDDLDSLDDLDGLNVPGVLDVESGTGLVWTATAGVAFKASPGSTFTLGVRYTDFEEVEFAEQTFELDPVTSLEIGLRLTF